MSIAASLSRSLELHKSAVDDLLLNVARVPQAYWYAPAGEGKWSPAEVVAHLVCTYDTVLGELSGGTGMAIRTTFWQRWLLRLTILPRILAGRGFPKGAVAPRETRPTTAFDRNESMTLVRRRAEELDAAARAARPSQRLTHAYFGRASVAHGVLLCARHIQHHSAQLVRYSP